jgi:amino acid adenylation domain-containing protein
MFLHEIIKPILDSIINFQSNNAFCINNRFYTYGEFNTAISKILSVLQKEKIHCSNIGLVANDDLETYASILAIWLEGFAYVPLHPRQPLERNLEIINQAEITVVLDSGTKLYYPEVKTIRTQGLDLVSLILNPKSVLDDKLAYILFTSGSTGSPKGVQITRKNIGVFIRSFWETGIIINENDRCLQSFDLTFDVSIQSFLVPLIRGACVYTIPHDQIKYSYVYGLLDDHQITFGAMAPSMIRYLRPYFKEIHFTSMRNNIITAEASPFDLIMEWSKCVPNADIYNFYGPTECTIYCTYQKFYRDGENKMVNGMLSIGKTLSGSSAIIIDKEKRLLGSDLSGELCISGEQLTPGYLNNNDKNNESFFFININGVAKRYYKTGDLAYIDTDGDIMLSGRLDYQVKIQGYRVELGEIEFHARTFLNGQNVIALDVANKIGSTEIALFIEGNLTDERRLIEYLKSKIPYYMVPTLIKTIKKFPLNTNGKLDRFILKEQLFN